MNQPPSGGCVLKQEDGSPLWPEKHPAAFGRLCVETAPSAWKTKCLLSQPPSGGCVLKHTHRPRRRRSSRPAAFGRLCVETSDISTSANDLTQPPSGGCVLKLSGMPRLVANLPSRLRAAVC